MKNQKASFIVMPTNRLFLGLLVLVLAACQPAVEVTFFPSLTPSATARQITAIPTVAVATMTDTPSSTPTHIEPSPSITPTETATITAMATETIAPSQTVAASLEPLLSPTYAQIEHFWLERPIAQVDGRTHWLDRTYPYGDTQRGTREVHLGVEFANPRFTAVLSAGDGIVYYAGDDLNQRFGPDFDYYGNVVIIQHPFPSPDGQSVYTLYAHLQDYSVETGDSVAQGQQIGRVGDTGIAIGPHLHFEVRVGEPSDYRSTHNPDLWIRPYANSGTLIGRVFGVENLYGIVIFVRSENQQRETYTYGGEVVNADPTWGENFTLGDLPAGTYDVLISDRNGRNYFRQSITIFARTSTWLEIDLSDTNYEGF